MGARTLVIPGNFPVGCSSSYLTTRASNNEEIDSTTGCIIPLNEFAEYHNGMLQTKLNMIREHHPNVNIIYADYFNAAMQFYRSPNEFGNAKCYKLDLIIWKNLTILAMKMCLIFFLCCDAICTFRIHKQHFEGVLWRWRAV